MKRHLIILWIISLLLTLLSVIISECHARNWDKEDKALFITGSLVQTIDLLQTNYIFNHEEYYEVNPLIDYGVKRIGKIFVPLHFIGSSVLRYTIADNLRRPYRTIFLTGCLVISSVLAIHNNSIGIGFSF